MEECLSSQPASQWCLGGVVSTWLWGPRQIVAKSSPVSERRGAYYVDCVVCDRRRGGWMTGWRDIGAIGVQQYNYRMVDDRKFKRYWYTHKSIAVGSHNLARVGTIIGQIVILIILMRMTWLDSPIIISVGVDQTIDRSISFPHLWPDLHAIISVVCHWIRWLCEEWLDWLIDLNGTRKLARRC